MQNSLLAKIYLEEFQSLEHKMAGCDPLQCVAYTVLGLMIVGILTVPTALLLFFGLSCRDAALRTLNPNTCSFIPSNTVAYVLAGIGMAIALPNLVCVFFSLRCFCLDPKKVAPSNEDDIQGDKNSEDVVEIFYAEDIIKMQKEKGTNKESNGSDAQQTGKNKQWSGEHGKTVSLSSEAPKVDPSHTVPAHGGEYPASSSGAGTSASQEQATT